jgi:hypothetical protein
VDIPVEKRFAVLSQITRAQHFAWRRAVVELCPDVDPVAVVDRMWEITGVDTARAYIKRLDPSKDLPLQVARSIAWSSQCMGEDAHVEQDGAEASVRHDECPWFDWHKKEGVLAEDRPGCDAWYRSTIDQVNTTLGTQLDFETVETLPEGGTCCRRRIWERS